jgi:transcriptional regulator with XRE-family HTH domain
MKQVSNFADRMKEYMKSHDGMTYEALSKLTGENPQTLNRYTLGQRVPKIDSAVNIALKLGISPMWLQGFDEPMQVNVSSPDFSKTKRSTAEESLLSDFRKLNRKGQEAALAAIKGFTCLPEYTEAKNEEVG